MRKYILLVVLFIGTIVSAEPSQQEALQTLLTQWRVQHNVPGATLLVQTPKENLVLVSGTTTMQGKEPITPNTLFGVGSITKTFISAMVLKLEAEDKLNINDPLGKYLTQYPRWKNITIKQLLNMTSGIQNFINNPTLKKPMGESSNSMTINQWIADIYQLPDNFSAGSQWEYSNTNYLLLGKIIETVIHKPLDVVLKQNFFKPLGLKNTYFSQTVYPNKIIALMAHGYHDDTDTVRVAPSNYGAAGAIFMNAKDLQIWATDLCLKKMVLPAPQLKEMLTGTALSTVATRKYYPPNSSYGLGIPITQDPKWGKMIWYTGVISGYSSIFLCVPDKQIVVVAQINRWTGDNYNLLFPNQALMQSVLSVLAGK